MLPSVSDKDIRDSISEFFEIEKSRFKFLIYQMYAYAHVACILFKVCMYLGINASGHSLDPTKLNSILFDHILRVLYGSDQNNVLRSIFQAKLDLLLIAIKYTLVYR
jgi:hypothetical protein